MSPTVKSVFGRLRPSLPCSPAASQMRGACTAVELPEMTLVTRRNVGRPRSRRFLHPCITADVVGRLRSPRVRGPGLGELEGQGVGTTVGENVAAVPALMMPPCITASRFMRSSSTLISAGTSLGDEAVIDDHRRVVGGISAGARDQHAVCKRHAITISSARPRGPGRSPLQHGHSARQHEGQASMTLDFGTLCDRVSPNHLLHMSQAVVGRMRSPRRPGPRRRPRRRPLQLFTRGAARRDELVEAASRTLTTVASTGTLVGRWTG